MQVFTLTSEEGGLVTITLESHSKVYFRKSQLLLSQYKGPEKYNRYIDDCISATYSTRDELTQLITTINSFRPPLKYTWEISDTSLAFLHIKFQLKATVYALVFVYYKHSDSHIYLLYSTSHALHVKNSISFRSFSDFVVYVVTNLILPTNQGQCASFSLSVASK